MVKVYHGSNIDAVNWKIFSDNIKKTIRFFPTGTNAMDIADQLCQCSLFDANPSVELFVVNIDNWKLTNDAVQQSIKELHALPNEIIFAIESSTIKNKIFSQLKVETIKATAVTKKAKATIVHKLLTQAKISLEPTVEEVLLSLLPEKIDFIKNEITKLQLMNQKTFSEKEIRQIVFDLGDATVFNITDSWLQGNQEQTITRLNDLISKNVAISAFVPIFALKLIQIKFFLTAKLARWSSETITAHMSLPFWQQSIYSNLKPYDQNLTKINNMLDKLYQFDINVKKQKNIPYTQLIKILFE